MGEEAIKKILTDFGLTEKESEVYIFLSKHGVLKCGEIANGMKRHSAQIYRILKILQGKGLVEATLEAPTRFSPIPFEKVLDLTIKAKHDEAAHIEETRQEVVTIWKNIRQAGLESSLQKFLVLEGNRRIYPKISQMIKDAKKQVSAAVTVPDLLRADNNGVFDSVLSHPMESKIQFRFLTELSSQNVGSVKTLLGRSRKAGFDFKVRNPDLGLQLSPRMVIRDNDEMIFFINKNGDPTSNELCLWTNCKELVNSFSGVFDDLWKNSSDIREKVAELETGKPITQTYAVTNIESAQRKYDEILNAAKDEVTLVTSAEGLIGWSKKILLLKKWASKGVFVKILAPIVSENLASANKLAECCFVKHIPASYVYTTLVDHQHLFQFKNQTVKDVESIANFENAFYTTDQEYIHRTENMLNDIWKNARELSDVTLVSLKEFLFPPEPALPKKDSEYTKMMGWLDYPKHNVVSEKDIIQRFHNGIRIIAKDPTKDIARFYGSRAIGIVHPPASFNLPDIILTAFLDNDKSSFGAEKRLMINAKISTPKGFSFLPVATVGDNEEALNFLSGAQAGAPSSKTQLMKKDELEIRLDGNTFFAGWTVPIPLNISNYILPPACMLIDGYGPQRTAFRKAMSPSGRVFVQEFILTQASLTFFHPASKYSGPGTEASIHKYCIGTSYPPVKNSGVQPSGKN
jgi:sugar-specific transcriptional regulator TrmB